MSEGQSRSVSALAGEIQFELLDASGHRVTEVTVPVSELTANQRTSLTNLLTTIRDRINAEAV